jgi:hypothetical protein
MNLVIPSEMREALMAAARRESVRREETLTVSAVVREACARWLAREARKVDR